MKNEIELKDICHFNIAENLTRPWEIFNRRCRNKKVIKEKKKVIARNTVVLFATMKIWKKLNLILELKGGFV